MAGGCFRAIQKPQPASNSVNTDARRARFHATAQNVEVKYFPVLDGQSVVSRGFLKVAHLLASLSGEKAGEGADGNVAADELYRSIAHASIYTRRVERVDLAVVGAIDRLSAGSRIIRRIAAVQSKFVGFVAPSSAAIGTCPP